MTNNDLVLARLRDAASTGTYTRLYVSMGALDTVRGLPGFTAALSGDAPSLIGYLWLDQHGYEVRRDPTLDDGFASFSSDAAAYEVNVWLEDAPMPPLAYYGTPQQDAVIEVIRLKRAIDIRADLERRYPGCVFTDAFVQAYAEGRA